MATKEVQVPDIGDFDDVDVIEVLVSEGDEVNADDPLITLETDKAAMDVPAPTAGTVKELKVGTGDKVSKGSVIAVFDTEEEKGEGKKEETEKEDKEEQQEEKKPAAKAPEEETGQEQPKQQEQQTPLPQGEGRVRGEETGPAQQAAGEKQAPTTPYPTPGIDEKSFANAHASPSVRKLARELGVDLGRVSGSGRKGRVTDSDVKSFVKSVMQGSAAAAGGGALPQVPQVDFSKFGEIESQPLSRIKKVAAPRLQASWINLPRVTQHDEADVTELEKTRKWLNEAADERGAHLTPLAFLVRASVAMLKKFPRANASLDGSGENLIVKKYFHIGFAVDTEGGLVVPVIRDADQKSLLDIARELAELADQARGGKLSGEAMQGASFTITSLGSIGGTAFTPIIQAPQAAILGVSRNAVKPIYIDGEFVPRTMMPLSLSYDHRIIDGAEAARITRFLAEVLGGVKALIL
jgi:pyruvate dehydrogenase E2 component (dihydrolipoamide acetyltransferase)